MRTPNLGLARTIAAHLTHESERMMRRENGEMLSAEQTEAMLTSVARAHLAKLDRVAALEIADGVDAAEGRSGLSLDGIEEVDRTITFLRERNLTGLPRAKLVSLLEACGAPQGEGGKSEEHTSELQSRQY